MTKSREIVSDLSTDSWKHLRHRLAQKIRRFWNEGAAIFVAATVLLVLAALCFRAYYDLDLAAEQRLRENFTKTVGTEHEPRDDIAFPGVTAAVLASVNRDGRTEVCGDSLVAAGADCAGAHATLDTMVALAWLQRNHSSGDNVSTLVGELRHKYVQGSADSEWNKGAIEAVSVSPRFAYSFPCDTLSQQIPQSFDGVGDADCIVDHRWADTVTLIPAALSSQLHSTSGAETGSRSDAAGQTSDKHLDGHATTSDSNSSRDDGLLRGSDHGLGTKVSLTSDSALGLSSLLDFSVDLGRQVAAAWKSPTTAACETSKPQPDCAPTPRWVAAYFISPENILTIWSAAGVESTLRLMPRARPWTAGSYFKHFTTLDPLTQKRESKYVTLAYLDLGGNGVVRTECRALRPSSNGKLAGIICVDYALDLFFDARFREGLTDNPMLTFNFVRIPPFGPIESADLPKAKASAGQTDDSAVVRRELSAAIGDREALAKKVQAFELSQGYVYVLILGKSADGTQDAIVISAKQYEGVVRQTVFILGLVFTILWICLVAVGLWTARTETQMRDRITLFRSLNIGIMLTQGQKSEIVGANDRAEELLGEKLPKEGDRSSGRGKSFWDFCERILEVDNDKFPDRRDKASSSSMILADASKIFERRRLGETTRYWVLLKSPKKVDPDKHVWLMVVASPLVQNERTPTEALLTYGAMTPASRSRRGDLEKSLRELLEKKRLEKKLNRKAAEFQPPSANAASDGDRPPAKPSPEKDQ